jgi:hypothetical protein
MFFTYFISVFSAVFLVGLLCDYFNLIPGNTVLLTGNWSYIIWTRFVIGVCTAAATATTISLGKNFQSLINQ